MNSLPRRRPYRVLWCAVVLTTMLPPAFGHPSDDPQQLQESAIARIDHWMDYVRHTGDAKSTLYELQTAESELQASSNLFLKPRRDALRQILKRGQERKELHPELDPDLAIDCLYGPMLYHMLNPYAPLDRKFARALVKQLFKGFRPA